MKKRLLAILGFLVLSVANLSCEANLAANNSSITVAPDSLTISAGISGDKTFAVFIADVQNENGIPLPDVDIQVSSALLRVLDSLNTLQNPGTEITLITDANGRAVITVEIPLATSFIDTLSVRSGSISAAEVNITGSVTSGS
jgi:hypothetical protein